MGDPGSPPLDPEHLLRVLANHGVDYVIVGGFAAAAHGADRLTFDVDIVPEASRDNMTRLSAALVELGAVLRIPGGDTVEFPIDASSLATMELSTWRTKAGDLDVIRGLPRTSMTDLATYRDLHERASIVSAFGLHVELAALDDIIVSKTTTNRETGRQALPELRRLARRSSEGDGR